MEKSLYLLLSAFAVYRLALMVAKESGPGRTFKMMRSWAKSVNCTFHEGVSCVHGESMWWSAVVTPFLVWRGVVEWQDSALVWTALSGTAIALHWQFTKDFKAA